MMILHAGFTGETLALWGEDGLPPRDPAAGRRKRAAKVEVPPPLLTGVPASRLVEVLSAVDPAIDAAALTMIGWLPAAAGRPAPSSPLIGESIPLAATRIEPWSIETLMLDPRDLAPFLATVVGKRLLAPGIVVGPDLAFFATAMRVAAALVARGHILPSIDRIDGSWYARWTDAPTAAERDEIVSLAKAMPYAALVLGRKLDAPPPADRQAAIQTFITTLVDRFMRNGAAPAKKKSASLHDRWMAALQAADGRLEGDSAELAALRQTLRDWRRPITEQSQFDFRIAFRLEEPEEGEDSWTIHFLLQATDDPSLLLPLSLVWKQSGGGRDAAAVRRLLQRRGGADEAHAFVLRSLGQAAAMSQAVDAALRTSSPSGVTTDTTGAFRFLSADAAALESAGFGVMLPSWWSRKGTKRRLTLHASAQAPKFKSASGLSLNELVQVQWQVALGDEKLTLADLRALARMKTPLIRLRGQWVQLTAAEIEEAIRFARTKRSQMPARELVRMSLAGATPDASLQIAEVEASGALGELLERLEGKREWAELPPPRGFEGSLRPYQARGFSWLDFLKDAGLGACLADDMGLGKTVQTLALIQKEWPKRKTPVLLVCPTSVTGNWSREAAKFTPSLPVMLHHGADRARGRTFTARAAKSAIVITSYALLTRDAQMLGGVPWKGLILDEAQNIKNSETKQAKAARSIESGFRIALTGTPVENNIGDLWSIIDFLNPGYLGSAPAFREKFFLPIQTRRDPEAIESLRRLTGPFILRRLKTDKSIIADLPEKNEMKVYCTLTKEQASLYEAVVQEAEAAIEESAGMSRKGLILATLTRLKQVCNHPRQLLGDGSPIASRSGKLNRLTEMLAEATESGDRALLFTQFAEMGSILQSHLQEQFGREVLFLHGATPRRKRDEYIELFQNEPDGPQLFVLSLKAGGTGLNLTRANHVFHFDRWWNPAVENQATDRAFRIGQTRSVQVHKFICGGTFEEKIDAMIEGKLELATRVVGTGEKWLTELSNRDLRELFALRADAVGE
jgi:SNF2 family DNA or RNA helicase